MARWSATFNNLTLTPVADGTNFTNAGYAAVQGGTTSQLIQYTEVYMGGLATSSTPCQMVFARDSVVGATGLSGGTLAPLNFATAALGSNPVQFNSSTTKPQRSASNYLLTPAFNAFGGVVRWVAAPGQEITSFGNTDSAPQLGEVSLSSVSGAGPLSCHIILEPF